MTFQIKQNALTETVKRKIFDGFGKEAIRATSINGPAYAKNTTFHYLRKNLKNQDGTEDSQQVMRVGVYGLVMDKEKILTIRQKSGPYAGKFDFPGGGIEFSESMEQALRREFLEEVAMEFDSMQLIVNLSTTIQVMQTASNRSYMFHHIGMIYRIEGCRLINYQGGDLQHSWVNLKDLYEDGCSALLWKYRMTLATTASFPFRVAKGL